MNRPGFDAYLLRWKVHLMPSKYDPETRAKAVGSGGDWGGSAVRRAAQRGVLGTAKEVGTVLTALANDVLLSPLHPMTHID